MEDERWVLMGRVKCWVCLGTGMVRGPLYAQQCTNPHCQYRQRPLYSLEEHEAIMWERPWVLPAKPGCTHAEHKVPMKKGKWVIPKLDKTLDVSPARHPDFWDALKLAASVLAPTLGN